MNKVIYILIFLAGMALLGTLSCKKLPRDNPLDQQNNANEIEGISLKFSKYEVAYDDNQDGVINQNETVYLKVYIKNNGNSKANDVKATIRSSSSYISSLVPTTSVKYNSGTATNDIGPGEERYGLYGNYLSNYYTVRFKVAANTPNGANLSFTLDMTDSEGNKWTDDFTVQVSASGALLNYSNHSVVYDDNDDGIINQNETVYLKVYIKNNGTSKANDVKAVISSASSFVSSVVPTTSVNYNSGYSTSDIGPGDEKYGLYSNYAGAYYTVRFKVAPNTPDGTNITFTMSITDGEENEWEDDFTVQVKSTGVLLNYSKHSIVYDDNDDGIINQNETVYLKVYIKNNGTSKANEVKAIISSASSFVSSVVPTTSVNYNSGYSTSDIGPGDEKYGLYSNYAGAYYTVRFKVAPNTPDGTNITFTMSITDGEENEWEDDFTVQVKSTGVLLNYSKHSIVYDDNDDGIINQNETVYLKVYIKNNGTSKANDVKAVISSASSFVSSVVPTTSVNYNSGYSTSDIGPGDEKYGLYSNYAGAYYTVRFKVALNTPGGTVITFDMDIMDEAENEWSDSFTVTVE